MKKTTLIFVGIALAILLLPSCGNSNKQSETNSSNTKDTKQVSEKKVFETENISVRLDNDWTITSSGAQNNDDYSVFSFIVNSSGNIYNDFNNDLEQIGEVTETTIDGMPAITRKQKFQQNETKLSRVWLIYNGENVLSFNVAAPENIFDDKVAKSIASKVKILHKGKNVQLPVDGKSKYMKPEIFPKNTINKFKDVLSSDNSLTIDLMNNAIKTLSALQSIDETKIANLSKDEKMAIADSIYSSHGFANIDEMLDKTLKPTIICATILTMIDKKKTDENVMVPFLKDFISQNEVSFEDLKFTYDNWDLVMKLDKLAEKNNFH